MIDVNCREEANEREDMLRQMYDKGMSEVAEGGYCGPEPTDLNRLPKCLRRNDEGEIEINGL